MCHKTITLAKNCDGHLSFCPNCNVYHLTFNNIYIELTEAEMLTFRKFIDQVAVDYWETKHNRTVLQRKIPIQTMQQNLTLVFNKQEFSALKQLVKQNTKKPFSALQVLDIDYTYFLN